jgi:hypothetical protein
MPLPGERRWLEYPTRQGRAKFPVAAPIRWSRQPRAMPSLRIRLLSVLGRRPSRRGEGLGNGAADAAAATGDYRNFARQFVRHSPIPF